MSLLSPMMTKTQLAAELGMSEPGLMNIQKSHPEMPRPIKIGVRLYWRREEVEEWLRNFLPKKK